MSKKDLKFRKILLTFAIAVTSFLGMTNIAFAQDVYKVTFSYSGTSQTVLVDAGDVVTPIEIPGREGYKFYRWINNKTQDAYDFTTPVNSNLVLAAQWKKEKGTDMQEIVAGNKDQSDITGVNPGEEFGLNKDKVKDNIMDRLDLIALSIAVFGIVSSIAFAVVYNNEKKGRHSNKSDIDVRKTIECHKCGRKVRGDATKCTFCGTIILENISDETK